MNAWARRPVSAFGRGDTAFGQDKSDQGRRTGGYGGVDGVGEDRVGPVRVGLEQEGDAFGVQHGGSIRTRRAEPLPGGLGVAAHLGDTVTAQQGPQVGQQAFGGITVGQRAGGRGPFGRRRPAFGCPWAAE